MDDAITTPDCFISLKLLTNDIAPLFDSSSWEPLFCGLLDLADPDESLSVFGISLPPCIVVGLGGVCIVPSCDPYLEGLG